MLKRSVMSSRCQNSQLIQHISIKMVNLHSDIFNSTGILHTFDLSYFNQLNKKVIENVCIVVFTILSYCDFFSSCSFHFSCGFSKCICHASFWICIIRDLFSGPHVSLILYSCIILDVKLVYIYFKILTMDNLSTHKIKNNIKGSVVALQNMTFVLKASFNTIVACVLEIF